MINVLWLPLYHGDGSPYKYMAIGQRIGDKAMIPFLHWYSARHDKAVQASCPYRSDGATCAPDIKSDGWWFHDIGCDTGKWSDGTPMTNWQCSSIIYDIMRQEGRNWFRCNRWRHATFLFGGGKARNNGMISLKGF